LSTRGEDIVTGRGISPVVQHWLGRRGQSISCRLAAAFLVLTSAACASKAPVEAYPALTPLYSSALDGGTLTPIAGTILVTVKPFAASPTETINRITVTTNIGDKQGTMRMDGRMSAERSGDLITILHVIEATTATGDIALMQEKADRYRGARFEYVTDAYGDPKSFDVSLSGRPANSTPEDDARTIDFGSWVLPRSGIRQGQYIEELASPPSHPSRGPSSYHGQLSAQGIGTCRGRKVIVFNEDGSEIYDGRIVDFHGYVFLDVATGAWIHSYMRASYVSVVTSKFRGQAESSANIHVAIETMSDLKL
jgi:hypothetical protein